MGVGAGGGRPLPGGWGGGVQSCLILSGLYRSEYMPGLFLSGFYRSEHISGLNCREKLNTLMYFSSMIPK